MFTEAPRSSKNQPILIESRQDLAQDLQALVHMVEYRPDKGNIKKHKTANWAPTAEKCPEDLKEKGLVQSLPELNQHLQHAILQGSCSPLTSGGYPKKVYWVDSNDRCFEAIAGGDDQQDPKSKKILYHGWEVKGWPKKTVQSIKYRLEHGI